MARITISNLSVIGSQLFADKENFLKELSDSELDIQGGLLADVYHSMPVIVIRDSVQLPADFYGVPVLQPGGLYQPEVSAQ
jgi:hypothetical protein